MTRSRNKKGSLSLSINAIVILILAITMLALGIGFIKNLFPDISDKVKEKVSDENDPPIPYSDVPITFSRDNVIGTRLDSEFVKVSVYCDLESDCSAPSLGVTCSGTTGSATGNTVTFGSVGYRKTGSGILRLDLGGAPGSLICTATAGTTISAAAKQAQFALTIN